MVVKQLEDHNSNCCWGTGTDDGARNNIKTKCRAFRKILGRCTGISYLMKKLQRQKMEKRNDLQYAYTSDSSFGSNIEFSEENIDFNSGYTLGRNTYSSETHLGTDQSPYNTMRNSIPKSRADSLSDSSLMRAVLSLTMGEIKDSFDVCSEDTSLGYFGIDNPLIELNSLVNPSTGIRMSSSDIYGVDSEIPMISIRRQSISEHPIARAISEEASNQYCFKRVLGQGSFSKVKLALHKPTGRLVAIKMVEGSILRSNPRLRVSVIREIDILRRVDHPNIIQLLEATIIGDCVCIITEYVPGCELYDYVTRKKCLSEEEAKPILTQLVSAVSHLHSIGIVHRDIKLENIIIMNSGAIKLIDFGLAKIYRSTMRPSDKLESVQSMKQILSSHYDTGVCLATRCGSEEYTAPEILLGKPYMGPPVDVWSLGVAIYAMICGVLPFNPDLDRPRYLCESITAVRYIAAVKRGVSESADSLIKRMIRYAPSERIMMTEILLHEFFS